MVTKLCKAKNPSTCRYHSSLVSSVSEEVLSKIGRIKKIEKDVERAAWKFEQLSKANSHQTERQIEGLNYNDLSDIEALKQFNYASKKLSSLLTEEEKDAIHSYTGLSYLLVNSYLRLGESKFIETSKPEFRTNRLNRAQKMVALLDSVFLKASNVEYNHGRLFRYVHQDTTKSFVSSEQFAVKNGWVKGATVSFPEFLSTSLDANIVDSQLTQDEDENTSVIFHISSSKGVPVGVTAETLSSHQYVQDAEREVLLPRGMTFKVVDVTRKIGYLPRKWSNNSRPLTPLTIFLEQA